MRNRKIDLYRMFFALIVLLAHSSGLKPPDPAHRLFRGGYLAVEFFLMLTGYFAIKKATRLGEPHIAAHQAAVWTGKKFLRIYQFAIPSVIIHYLVHAWLKELSVFETIKQLFYGTFEMLLLSSLGIYETILVSPLWYLSALLAILPLFYFMAIRLKDTFFYLVCPLSVLFVYGYFSMTYGHLCIWHVWTGTFFLSLPRAWAGLCLGGLCYLISERLKNVTFSGGEKTILLSAKFLCLIGSVIYMQTRFRRRLDFLCVGALFLVIVIEFSEITLSPKSSNSFLAGLSLALYVSHWTVRTIINALMSDATYIERLEVYLVISIIYAVMLTIGVKAVRTFSFTGKLKQAFICKDG